MIRSNRMPVEMPDRLTAYLAPIFDTSCLRGPLAVAVSGGADSMALALLAADWCDQQKIPLTALTVDHGLRTESAVEAKRVAQWMKACGITHAILTPASLPIANIQNRAREMRYSALSEWCETHGVQTLLLAHHADDQAETVALQNHRGDSAPSRAGMALVRMHGSLRIVRPLLGVRKYALVDHLQTMGQEWIEDPSNQNSAFSRVRVRQTMDEARLQTLWHAAQAAGAERHRDATARSAWLCAHGSSTNDGISLDRHAWQNLPDAMRTDMLSRCIQAVGHRTFRPRAHETARLDATLRQAPFGKATLGHCVISWDAAHLHLNPEHPLEESTNPPYITRRNPLNQLAEEQFWWFNYPLFS